MLQCCGLRTQTRALVSKGSMHTAECHAPAAALPPEPVAHSACAPPPDPASGGCAQGLPGQDVQVRSARLLSGREERQVLAPVPACNSCGNPAVSWNSTGVMGLVCSFAMSMGGLAVFENDDQTRTFLALAVVSGCEQVPLWSLLPLLQSCASYAPSLHGLHTQTNLAHAQVCRAIRRVDRVFLAHGLAQFHREPRPHVSLLWALGSQAAQLQAALQAGQAEQLHAPAWEVIVRRVECRIGERVYAVWERPM